MRTAVIGAGWAGLAAAWHLRMAGREVTLFDAAARAGGRARQIKTSLAGQEVVLDNGQHLLIGAYRESLDMIRAAHGLAPRATVIPGLTRMPLQFDSQSLRLRRQGPGRLGLAIGFLAARGLDTRSRWRMLTMTARLAAARWQGFDGQTVAALLNTLGQTSAACERFWYPLCIAAMNTPPDAACAQTFVNILYDSMLASRDGSDFLVPVDDLGSLLPEPMTARLRSLGADVRLGEAVRTIDRETAVGAAWHVGTSRGTSVFDDAVLATPAWQSARLLARLEHPGAHVLDAFEQEAIQTVFLAWHDTGRVTLPVMRMLDENHRIGHYGQWMFARRPQQGLQIAAVVISVRAPLSELTNAALAERVATQVCSTLQLPEPADAIAVNEKRATFRCLPDRPRVTADAVGSHPLPVGMAIAGDYCVARYPGTLEAAIISGRLAAARLLQQQQG